MILRLLSMIDKVRRFLGVPQKTGMVLEKSVVEAYDLWADQYDVQPGNLMIDLDALVLNKLLSSIDLRKKIVADIGCGTGRHWPKILAGQPGSLTGFDVSSGMLAKLKKKYPEASTYQIYDNQFETIRDASYDLILSTLTVAHIEDLEQALHSWFRILKSSADIILTDFHPMTLASGGQRTFKHKQRFIAVQNFVHQIPEIETILKEGGFQIVRRKEIRVSEEHRHYYEAKNALHVYQRYLGSPIIYGIHARRDDHS